MVALRVWLHDAKCTFIEAHARARAELELVAARDQVEREARDLRISLAAERARLQPEPLTGRARRMANLTYDILDAREKAMANYHNKKAHVMAQFQQLLKNGHNYTQRELATLLGISLGSVNAYRRDLLVGAAAV